LQLHQVGVFKFINFLILDFEVEIFARDWEAKSPKLRNRNLSLKLESKIVEANFDNFRIFNVKFV
jgi:hypothetical protein